jgi:hypothetical protein
MPELSGGCGGLRPDIPGFPRKIQSALTLGEIATAFFSAIVL